MEMRDCIEYKENKYQKGLHHSSWSQEEATVGTGATTEEDMLEEEEARSLAITVANKGTWQEIARCLPKFTVTIVRLRIIL